MGPLIYDIETGPETDEVLALMEPEFTAPANYKDTAKIAEKIEEQREAWREKAALCATTGRVLAIGMADEGGIRILSDEEDEAGMLREFWSLARPDGGWRYLIGFNSNRFDIPFIVRRSYKLGVPVPKGVTNGRYLNPRFIDIMDAWKVGDYQASISLDRLAKHLGCGSKNGNGADFARLLVEDREAAMAYLENDIRMTLAVARKVGLVEPEEDY